MKFNDWQDIVEHYEKEEEKIIGLEHVIPPTKPVQDKYDTHEEYGRKLDLYEKEKTDYNIKKQDLRVKISNLRNEMEGQIFKFFKVNIEKPQIKEAWRMAWDRHGSGYIPVIEFFEELLDLIKMKD